MATIAISQGASVGSLYKNNVSINQSTWMKTVALPLPFKNDSPVSNKTFV